MENIVFGPVPSRRLGLSLGVNNVYDKYCSYSCIYCQAGLTSRLIIERRVFYDPIELAEIVVREASKKNPDVISFVPNGEPTLDINLGREVELIKEKIKIPIAIFTNASLIYREDVREDLRKFDIVSVKIDSVIPVTWKKINRPHPALKLDDILEDIKEFSRIFNGKLITETMIVHGVNDREEEYLAIAEFIKNLKIHKAYIQVPVRPPAVKDVKPPSEDKILRAYDVFRELLGEDKVGLLTSPEPEMFKFSDDLVKEIAKTIYVHPIKIDYIYEISKRRNVDPKKIIDELVEKGYAAIVKYMGNEFLVPRTHARYY